MADRDPIEAFIDRLVAGAALGSAREEADLRRELQSHFEDVGPSPEAREAALARFGAEPDVAALLRAAHRTESLGVRLGRPLLDAVSRTPAAARRRLDQVAQDLRFGARLLRRSPGFSLVAIVCLAAGIGANTAVFGWVEGILFRPFPLVAHQDRMVALTGTARGEEGQTDLSWPDLLDLAQQTTFADAFIADKITGATLNLGTGAQKVTGSIVSANYFQALGVRPALGRLFEPGEDAGANAHPVVILNYRLWRDLFAADPAVIGQTQRINGFPHTIVGVAPEGFDGTFVGYAMQLWVPASMEQTFETGGYKLEDRGARWIEGFAFLKPGVSLARAQSELSALSARLATDHPATNRGWQAGLVPLWQTPFNKAGELRPTLGILLAVAACVLLIVCANVGNLLLVRALGRRREMTIRLAVGAGGWRLVSQLLTEGLLLALCGAAGAVLLARWCQDALVWFFPYRVTLPEMLDGRVLALSAGVTLGSTLVMGLVPALQTRRVNLVDALRAESGAVMGSHRGSVIRSGLVLVQVSLSFALLVGASLLVESLRAIEATNPGFATDGVLATSVDLVGAGYEAGRAADFLDTLTDRLRALPGVDSVTVARTLPLGLLPFSEAPIAVAGYIARPDEQPTVEYNPVGPDYFRTVGTALIAGRAFTPADTAVSEPVAIVNARMVAEYWGGRNPIGTRFKARDRWLTVVGVSRTSKYGALTEPDQPFFYVPLRQEFSGRVAVEVKTACRAADLAPALTQAIRALDPALVAYDVVTVRDRINRATSSQRIAVALLVGFGGLALVLAAIGLYGVMSYAVSERTREMGLRMSLGASAADLVRTVMSRGAVLTLGGLLVGLAMTLVVTRNTASLLYQVRPTDPWAYGWAALALAVAALVACGLPAWRATRIDPLRALRP